MPSLGPFDLLQNEDNWLWIYYPIIYWILFIYHPIIMQSLNPKDHRSLKAEDMGKHGSPRGGEGEYLKLGDLGNWAG